MSAACAPVAFTAALTARSTQTRASTQPCSRIQTEQIVLGWTIKARTRAHARGVARAVAYRASPLRNAMRSSRSCAQVVSSQLRVAGESSPWRWQSRNARKGGLRCSGREEQRARTGTSNCWARSARARGAESLLDLHTSVECGRSVLRASHTKFRAGAERTRR